MVHADERGAVSDASRLPFPSFVPGGRPRDRRRSSTTGAPSVHLGVVAPRSTRIDAPKCGRSVATPRRKRHHKSLTAVRPAVGPELTTRGPSEE